jgi:transcription initiation factor TFIID subunit TAF12
MARFEEEDPFVISGMTDSTSTESDDPEFRSSPPQLQQQQEQQQQQQQQQEQLIEPPICVKRQHNAPNMAESFTGVSWSEDFDQHP